MPGAESVVSIHDLVKEFGTLRVLSGGKLRVDFATSRREQYPEPASLPVVTTPAPLDEPPA